MAIDNALVLRITAQTDEFVKTVDQAKDKVKSLTNQMAEIDKQLKQENVDKVGKLSEKLDLMKRAAEMAKKEVDLYGQKIAALTSKHKSAEQMTDREKQQVAKLAERMAEAQQKAATFAGQVDKLEKELRDTADAADDAAKEIKETGDNANTAGGHALTLGDLIKGNVISAAITAGLSKVKEIFEKIAEKIWEATKAVGRFIVESIDLAANMEETKSKVSAVFGEEGLAEIETWADNASHDFHTTKQAAMEAAASFGNIMTNMGLTTAASQDYAQELVLVAAAQADFNNLPTTEVLEKIQSALSGNYEGLRALGIVINDATITERALIDTHKENASELTDLEKKQAALNLIIDASSTAVVKYKENSGSLVSMQGELKAKFEEVKTEIGSRLYPVAENLFNKIVEFTNTQQFSDLLDTIYDAVTQIADKVIEFISGGQLDSYIQWLTDNLPTLGDKISDVAGKVADVVGWIWSAIDALVHWKEHVTDWMENTGWFKNLPGTGDYALPSEASGGPVSAGHIYQVNDDHGRNTEMFIPAVNGYILNGNDTQRVINNTTNNSRNYGDLNVYVNSYGADAVSIADEIGVALNQKLRMAGTW